MGFRVLRVLRMAEGPLPLREIASRAQMPPSKVHLYLVSFVREQMAYQDLKNGYYGLGSFAIQLGLAAIRQIDVVSLAADLVDDLRDKTDCAVYLSLWGDRGPCIVSKADGSLQGAFSVRLGYILPVTTTATGLVFLAYLPQNDADKALEAQLAYDAAMGNTTSLSKKAVMERTVTIRAEGYASTVGMLHRNFAGMAAPVFDFSGRIAAGLTLLGPNDYVVGDRQETFRHLLLDAAETISQRLGAAAKAAAE
ncbi:MAG: IclR family transcriptional regulator [Sphingobium sp.]